MFCINVMLGDVLIPITYFSEPIQKIQKIWSRKEGTLVFTALKLIVQKDTNTQGKITKEPEYVESVAIKPQ